MTRVRLVQLIDANDVNPDGTLDFTAPFDRPYDWTASGDPRLLARTFGFFVTDAGLARGHDLRRRHRPVEALHRQHRRGGPDHDGTVGDDNGDGTQRGRPCSCRRPTSIARAHDAGLLVHTWTFRNEQQRLVSDYAGNPVNEYLQFYQLGVDGVFSDFADTAVVARALFELERACKHSGGPKRHQPDCAGD